uniref:hypothetical protein n=1 Tax=Streptomyces chumphonensis TaxID=1214925 RepID=UPI003D741374
MPDRTPVSGPFRITVESIPSGVHLDVAPFVRALMHEAVELLLNDAELGERFDALAEEQPADPYVVQRPADLRFEQLVADLTTRVASPLPVYGIQVLRLAERLRRLGESKPVPGQRRGAEGGA